MQIITLREYNAIHPDFAGRWTTERDDLPDWPLIRDRYMGKRTMMSGDGTCTLLIEGMHFVVAPCDHNEMVPNDDPQFAWKCAICGHVYGKDVTHEAQ